MRHSIFPHQLRQLRNIRCNPSRFKAGEQIGSRAPAGVTLEIYVSERLPVLVADDEACAVRFLDGPRGGKLRFPRRRLETRRRSRATQSDSASLELRRERGNFKRDVHQATRRMDMPNRDSALPHIS
jgi:hypothetical protein